MITVSVGIGKTDVARRSASDAATQAAATLPNKRADCALVFGSSSLNQDEILLGVSDIIKNIPIIGCSSAFEITSEGLATEDSVVVVLFNSDQVRFSTGFGTHMEWNSRQSGKDCAQTIDPTAKDILLFANMLPSSAEDSIDGIREKLNTISITAGGAADNLRFFETSQYFNLAAYSDAVVGLGLSGMYTSASVSVNGFLPVGVLRNITKSEKNIIKEIDGFPAVRLYEDYFGDEYIEMLQHGKLMSFATSYPLGIYEEGSVKPILRIPTHINIETGEIHLGGSIPPNSGFRLMISDKRQNTQTAKDAAIELMNKLGEKKPKFVLMLSSVARRKVVGNSWSAEISEIQEIVGVDVPIAGFYGYAEYSDSGASDKKMYLNNGSLVLWAIAE